MIMISLSHNNNNKKKIIHFKNIKGKSTFVRNDCTKLGFAKI